ncbi:cytochrome ubiquinol oxidase subunit I [Simkania negevensis]|uniref:Cytochrome ubiquinol oxidase subunit I n=1 Tax=Simkania negevensis TaxID=83561 RepID=A0ABS3ARJ7_9BACT|nr:cytochrome ubiquinol oxidase subunit I [Simkania negevensis]
MNAELLSRIQYGFHSGFHFIFPPLTIGLSLALVIFEAIYLKTKKPEHEQMVKFWIRIFAVIFVLGVVTGFVQIFGFGTNWARYSYFVGDVFGSALGAEGLFAFFLESGALGILLFGWQRVRKSVHFIATIAIAVGTHFSGFWIIAANSWMQTPTGHRIVSADAGPRAEVTDFWTMLLNYSTIPRFLHVTFACWLTGAFFLISVAAYYYLKKKHLQFSKMTMRVGITIAVAAILLQGWAGDMSAKVIVKHQPAKLAAVEGVFKTKDYTPAYLFGSVDMEKQKVNYGIKIPGLLSFLSHGNPKTAVTGLDQIPRSEWPNVAAVFQTYHLMLSMYAWMFFIIVCAVVYLIRRKLHRTRWILWAMVFTVLAPQMANLAGWMTTEMGRQPWLVYGVLKTTDGLSDTVREAPGQVVGSLIMFTIIFAFLFVMFIYMLNHKIQHGPEDVPELEGAAERAAFLKRKK